MMVSKLQIKNYNMKNKLRIIAALLILLICYTAKGLSQSADTSQLTAVLVVGHVEESTKAYISHMNTTAAFFARQGIKVYKFYDKNAKMDDIVRVAAECNFFVYSGHGSEVQKRYVPGIMCIDKMVSSVELLDKVKFTKKPLVIYNFVCSAAGSTESDTCDIQLNEARRRTLHYATTFADMGASGYYATNYDGSVVSFLKIFFKGKSLLQTFNDNMIEGVVKEKESFHPKYRDLTYVITSSPAYGMQCIPVYKPDGKFIGFKKVPGFKTYDMALLGPAGLTMDDIRRANAPSQGQALSTSNE